MRCCVLAAVLVAAPARAEVSGAIGAGAQGAGTYSAIELRLDGEWPHARVGLGVRGVWDDGTLRRWRAAELATVIRDVRAWTDAGDTRLGVAAGGLAPSVIGHVVDGYRASLDDRWRTGVRAVVQARELDVVAEIDDVVDPAVIGGAVQWQLAGAFGVHVAMAIDPRNTGVVEGGVSRRSVGERARGDVGVSLVGELGLGVHGVAFGRGELERGGVRWLARGDVRAGTGTVGSLFGPLYRAEREMLREHAGVGGGLSVGIADFGELGMRWRPGLGGLVTASAGSAIGKRVQAGVWAAVGRDLAVGAAEARVTWAPQLWSALQVARMFREGEMAPVSSVVAWFGVCSGGG